MDEDNRDGAEGWVGAEGGRTFGLLGVLNNPCLWQLLNRKNGT